jgi:hypothetical protein
MSLLVKLALIVPLLLLGAFNLLVVGPRLRKGEEAGGWLRRVSGAETALMAVVVGVAVLLTNLPPARIALPPKLLDVLIHSNNYAFVLKMAPVLPGYHNVDMQIESHDGKPIGPEAKIDLQLVMREHDMGHNATEGKYLAPGHFQFESVLLGMPGTWDFVVNITRPGVETEQVSYTLTVPELP